MTDSVGAVDPARPDNADGAAAPVGPAVHVRARVPDRAVDLDLTWPLGTTLALIGPNGAGKTTTIDVLAGTLTGHGSTVTLGDRDLTDLPAHRRRLGCLEQRALLFPHMSVLANVEFGMRAHGVRRPRARAREELEAVGCGHLAGRRPHQVSGGQAQRIALARALATDPDLVLLDEPLSALDAALAPAMRRLLRARLAGTTALLVTHDVLDVLALADRVAVIEGGRLVAEGPTDAVLASAQTPFVEDFVGTDRADDAEDSVTLSRSRFEELLRAAGERGEGQQGSASSRGSGERGAGEGGTG
ncbi:ATP-binding cassette domain-containing protein [Helcobacillus sp. ACRRO]|uniref:sulfate/molybdate ABC transporter ATP-binding protein n=1 Tax=Helcobacillus sp. ACRRO TaxID=2918202 RepID=UPI001EF6E631|nr:ATP-binding cassette domain-containing protein [Helcobacillus sp. ACRRO]MCG7428153.1 ATP-binding cassette domain-containing protein [Helcobacillus sp. ACRRO]